MKLNLLPTHVSKEGQTKVAWFVSGTMAVAAAVAAFLLVGYSRGKLDEAKARVATNQPLYDQAKKTAQEAEDIMAASVVIDRNVKLAKAMTEHNAVYPALYHEVLSYVPSFFRVNSIAAVPTGPDACTVTMQGVMQSYQQYADIMLAMLRIPGATNVTRAGFTDVRKVVPALNQQDQIGTPVRPGEPNLPSDPQARLDELVNRAGQAPGGFEGGTGGFGQVVEQKGAMPDWSLTTITVTLSRNIQTPNPRATLTAQGGQNPGGGQGGFTPPPGPQGGGK